jgi:WD40 repeat protein
MVFFSNENLLNLIFQSWKASMMKKMFPQINNKTLSKTMIKILSYENIFKSLGTSLNILEHDTNVITHITLLPDGNIISVSTDSKLRLWDMNTYSCIRILEEGIKLTVLLINDTIAAYSPIGLKLLCIKVDFKCTKIIPLEDYLDIYSLHVLTNGNLACGVEHQQPHLSVVILDCNNEFEYIDELEDSGEVFALVNLSMTNLAGSQYNYIHIWDVSGDYNLIHTIEEHDCFIESLIFIDEFDLLISGSLDQTIRVWDIVDNYKCIDKIETSNMITCLLKLSSGYFASGFLDCTEIKIWDLVTFSCINTFHSSGKNINNMLLLKDKRIITIAKNDTIVWN